MSNTEINYEEYYSPREDTFGLGIINNSQPVIMRVVPTTCNIEYYKITQEDFIDFLSHKRTLTSKTYKQYLEDKLRV